LFESDHPAYHGEHINFSDALFSPRPRVPIPIVVGGSSKRALRRAANLGDGWLGLRLSPDAAGLAIAEMRRIGHRPDFTLSLRLQVRVGGSVDDADPATTLHGDVGAVVEQLQKYSDIGVEQVVIEPFANELPDFVEQMRLFAQEIAPLSKGQATPSGT
jgi:alkanesulfonate monooxygenase SsuD/methylene tetrahydromethanopterin reductase-like flavin-dependent oxidoreductase (luciferase family)